MKLPINKINIRVIRTLLILIITTWGSFEIIKNKPWTKNNELVKVIKVKDGDSIIVSTSKGQKDLRIWGIDAPERGQPYADVAKKKLQELVLNKYIRIENPKTDDFHRDLAFISITNYPNGSTNEIDVGSVLISQGLAWHFHPDATHDKQYKTLETEAKNKNLGLWADPNPKNPEDYRRELENKSPKNFKFKIIKP